MIQLNRKISARICVVFALLYLIFMFVLTNWKTDDLRGDMHNDFMNAYEILFQFSVDEDFEEQADIQMSTLSARLANRGIYAAAVILDSQGSLLAQSDFSKVSFNGRQSNAVDLNRLEDCVRAAQNAFEHFPKGRESSVSSSGPEGHTQGWTIYDADGNARYIFVNAKFFERELAVEQMIDRYILSFIVMGATCLSLCIIISRLVNPRKVATEARGVL